MSKLNGSELFERYVAHGVSTKELAELDLDTLIFQIWEMRQDENAEGKPDLPFSDVDIAEAIMEHAVTDALYLRETGERFSITVFPGGTKDGLDYGPAVVEMIVLDTDGATVTYRYSTDAQDDDWQIGDVEDAVREAASNWDAAQ